LVTANEVCCSEDVRDRFRLYRVFDFSRRPRVDVSPDALSAWCQLEPTLYRVRVVGEGGSP
jgi:hypothetical protein